MQGLEGVLWEDRKNLATSQNCSDLFEIICTLSIEFSGKDAINVGVKKRMMTGFSVLMSMRTVIHLVLSSTKFPKIEKRNLMKFVEKYAKLFALLGVISVSTWGMGCANSDSATSDKPKAEAGSSEKEASGKKEASGEKKEEKKEEKKAE
jgi:hypothetical protein